jgi:phosphoglycerate kinase
VEWLIIYLNIKVNWKIFKKKNCDKIIEEIFSLSKKNSCKIIYPEDVVVGKILMDQPKIKELNEISKDELILDIGPKTIKKLIIY